jgi:hypothetical protein
MTDEQFALYLTLVKTLHQEHLAQLRELKDALASHVQVDEGYHRVVDRHATYWRGLWAMMTGVGATVLSWVGLRNPQ